MGSQPGHSEYAERSRPLVRERALLLCYDDQHTRHVSGAPSFDHRSSVSDTARDNGARHATRAGGPAEDDDESNGEQDGKADESGDRGRVRVVSRWTRGAAGAARGGAFARRRAFVSRRPGRRGARRVSDAFA
ncbi:hypothetical protein BURKHO8Y_30226 [Burkholderia sp. 8Y]|nr:hypothetical protein BURKHO8Y_30226 [Burkholderia sp. 8Y]